MIWLQGGTSFIAWIAYGVIQSRRSYLIREQVSRMGRTQRGIAGAALFLVGAMVLIGGLGIVLQKGGFTSAGLSAVAWPAVTVLGLAFVHAQTMAMSMLVSLVQDNVTNGHGPTSINTTPEDQSLS
ncbi:MAG: hypothetical protein ACHQ50_04765 [Fimbriimonadales bacterium]